MKIRLLFLMGIFIYATGALQAASEYSLDEDEYIHLLESLREWDELMIQRGIEVLNTLIDGPPFVISDSEDYVNPEVYFALMKYFVFFDGDLRKFFSTIEVEPHFITKMSERFAEHLEKIKKLQMDDVACASLSERDRTVLAKYTPGVFRFHELLDPFIPRFLAIRNRFITPAGIDTKGMECFDRDFLNFVGKHGFFEVPDSDNDYLARHAEILEGCTSEIDAALKQYEERLPGEDLPL